MSVVSLALHFCNLDAGFQAVFRAHPADRTLEPNEWPALGRQFAFGKSLAIEFSTKVLQAILVIWLLAQTRIGSFAGRVGFVLVAAILAAITTNVSYWNWYGFPGVYSASYMLIEIVGFALVGVAAGLVLRKRTPAI